MEASVGVALWTEHCCSAASWTIPTAWLLAPCKIVVHGRVHDRTGCDTNLLKPTKTTSRHVLSRQPFSPKRLTSCAAAA